MRIPHILPAVGLAVLAPIAVATAGPADEVRAASAAWDEAFNAENLDALMDRYHEDAVSMVPGHPSSAGKAAIRSDFEGLFAGNEARHATDIQEVVVREDIAVERAHYTMEITPEDGDPVTEAGKHIIVYRRAEDGAWRVLWEIWNEGQ